MEVLESLAALYDMEWPLEVNKVLYGPASCPDLLPLEEARSILESGTYEFPDSWLPLGVVDDVSLACVVGPESAIDGLRFGDVVRWRLDDVPTTHQAELLDIDPFLYVVSLAEELTVRQLGLDRMLDEIGPAYEENYLARDKRPRDFVIRPIRIACQNVIVGLAAIAQDTTFDGLSVIAWQTCEVPHLATHEANRALAALTLCDAFQNGGTMEVRFDRTARLKLEGATRTYYGHPERQVPASLRRYGRTVGVELGSEDPGSISPTEARKLFMAVTPMPSDLRKRCEEATSSKGITPERLCFTLLSQTWRELELDVILALSSRASSILSGGADWTDRAARQAETEICRNAVMAGMLFQRLDTRDKAAGEGGIRVVEDDRVGVDWTVLEECGAIHFRGLDQTQQLPWLAGTRVDTPAEVTVLPRAVASTDLAAEVESLRGDNPVAVLMPLDAGFPLGIGDATVLRCPERMADLDKTIEARLLTLRVARG